MKLGVVGHGIGNRVLEACENAIKNNQSVFFIGTKPTVIDVAIQNIQNQTGLAHFFVGKTKMLYQFY